MVRVLLTIYSWLLLIMGSSRAYPGIEHRYGASLACSCEDYSGYCGYLGVNGEKEGRMTVLPVPSPGYGQKFF